MSETRTQERASLPADDEPSIPVKRSNELNEAAIKHVTRDVTSSKPSDKSKGKSSAKPTAKGATSNEAPEETAEVFDAELRLWHHLALAPQAWSSPGPLRGYSKNRR